MVDCVEQGGCGVEGETEGMEVGCTGPGRGEGEWLDVVWGVDVVVEVDGAEI